MARIMLDRERAEALFHAIFQKCGVPVERGGLGICRVQQLRSNSRKWEVMCQSAGFFPVGGLTNRLMSAVQWHFLVEDCESDKELSRRFVDAFVLSAYPDGMDKPFTCAKNNDFYLSHRNDKLLPELVARMEGVVDARLREQIPAMRRYVNALHGFDYVDVARAYAWLSGAA